MLNCNNVDLDYRLKYIINFFIHEGMLGIALSACLFQTLVEVKVNLETKCKIQRYRKTNMVHVRDCVRKIHRCCILCVEA